MRKRMVSHLHDSNQPEPYYKRIDSETQNIKETN